MKKYYTIASLCMVLSLSAAQEDVRKAVRKKLENLIEDRKAIKAEKRMLYCDVEKSVKTVWNSIKSQGDVVSFLESLEYDKFLDSVFEIAELNAEICMFKTFIDDLDSHPEEPVLNCFNANIVRAKTYKDELTEKMEELKKAYQSFCQKVKEDQKKEFLSRTLGTFYASQSMWGYVKGMGNALKSIREIIGEIQ